MEPTTLAANATGKEDSFSPRPRGRPQARVSFQLPQHDGDGRDDRLRLTQSDPVGCALADAPRNRRRLFRDVSYTSRAVRRSHVPVTGNGRATLSSIDGPQSSHHRCLDAGSPRAEHGRYAPPRRSDSFRGKHRRGDSGRAGSALRSRAKAQCEEWSQRIFRSCFGRGNELGSSAPRRSISHHQYHIPPPEESHVSALDAFFRLFSLGMGDVAMWLYGASFGKVLLFFLALYMALVYLFVMILYLVDRYCTGSACINGSPDGKLGAGEHLEFAFELSWTTFTTVGYGNMGPPPDIGCYPIRLVCSVEAILGIAFVSICSGLFYARLLNLLGRAPVSFSSTLCVQYGEGLEPGKTSKTCQSNAGGSRVYSFHEDSENRSTGLGTTQDEVFHPFPVIEFRIVNNRANHAPGRSEIWDAEVTALVQLSLENDPNANVEGASDAGIPPARRPSICQPLGASKGNNDDDQMSEQVLYKLDLKPSSHPYFSRVWFLRHTLDDTSPLLRREVRNMIKGSSNGWDPTFDNYQDIRKCLVEFNTLQVTMSGASALSRSEVFAEKTYTYDDVYVGWRFIAVCYEEESGKRRWPICKRVQRKLQNQHFSYGDDTTTRVDLSLIHDIVPQRGDFEPF